MSAINKEANGENDREHDHDSTVTEILSAGGSIALGLIAASVAAAAVVILTAARAGSDAREKIDRMAADLGETARETVNRMTGAAETPSHGS